MKAELARTEGAMTDAPMRRGGPEAPNPAQSSRSASSIGTRTQGSRKVAPIGQGHRKTG